MKKPDDWTFVAETIGGLQPLGAFTRAGDENWTRLVRWTHYALLKAEELGINKGNVDAKKANPGNDPEVRRFVGVEGDFGKLLGVDNEWSYRIVKDIGNYAELWDATFGKNGLGLPRGMNELYSHGGLQWMPTWH
jgi:general L-amino acid transport system substrate-binding protein